MSAPPPLGVAGVRVGCWTSPDAVSGCTVVLPPEETVGAIAVRGASPGTREAAALGPSGKVSVCHGIVLAGGSGFGLASADGVVDWLERRGVGYPVGEAVVPIVGAAILLDGAVARPDQRPGPGAGAAACEAAYRTPSGGGGGHGPPDGGSQPGAGRTRSGVGWDGGLLEGSIGAGAGCTVAKVGGLDHAWRSGQGVAVRSAAGVTVGAIVANNALGEVVAADGSTIASARIPPGEPRYPFVPMSRTSQPHGDDRDAGRDTDDAAKAGPASNTVIGVVVTDARLDKLAAHRVADLAHSGIARAIRPAHTIYDGDALFCLATGTVDAETDLVIELASEAVAEAARRGPLTARAGHGLPALRDAPQPGT